MDFLITGVAFILIFSVLVLIHEGGHYFAAIKSGIKVEEFGFGLPPRLWGVKKGETLYSINAIPFGGFVRLLGEDKMEAKFLKNKRSFIGKPARVRIMVIVAGVLMNFLLALLLLTVGFSFGIQPLILDGDDVLAGITDGTIQVQQGIMVKEVMPGGPADLAGLKQGDKIDYIDGKEVTSQEQIKKALKSSGKPVSLDFWRDGKAYRMQLTGNEKSGLDFKAYDILFLPRVAIQSVKPGSASDLAGLKSGDTILSINGSPVYYMEEYNKAIGGTSALDFMVGRSTGTANFRVELPQRNIVIISSVFENTPAETAGLRKGDIILSLDGNMVTDPKQAIAYTKENAAKDIVYELNRNGEKVYLSVRPLETGLIGVGLSTVYSYENNDLSVYSSDSVTSIVKINDVRYPVWVAPVKALEESGRLSILTGKMFIEVIRSVVTRFTVPEGVAGVVGIAQLTHVFVQEGALPVLRFMALLSLSLAIINIFPLPALDGGKLLFIVIEVIIGRRVGSRFEGIVHTIGFVLLLLLIFAVTYNDIARLFV